MSGRRRRTRLGQHLLRDERVLDRIIETVPLDPSPILEVGTGDGALTARLAELDRPLVSMELDESMAFRARRKLASDGLDRSAVVVEGDILEADPEEALALVASQPPYGLVGNLPYAITAMIFRKFLEEESARPAWMLVMIQHEVAQRVTAMPGKLSLMGVSVQFYAEAELLFVVEREAFDPPPQVRSAVVMLQIRDHQLSMFRAWSDSSKSFAAGFAVRASSYIMRWRRESGCRPAAQASGLTLARLNPRDGRARSLLRSGRALPGGARSRLTDRPDRRDDYLECRRRGKAQSDA